MVTEVAARGDRRSRAPVRFDPIQPQRAHEYVAEQIRRYIALRLIRPGQALPSERDLAAMFGVGRPTIQQALRLLLDDALVEARRGRRGGTFVTAPTEGSPAKGELVARLLRARKEIDEVLAYRRVLEPAVSELAAETARRADLTAMRSAITDMSQSTSEAEYMRHDTVLHLAIARATRNRFLVAAIEDVRLRLNDVMSLLPESDVWHRRLAGEHEAVVDAIAAGDARAARVAMEEHVSNSERGVRAVLAAIRRLDRAR